MRRTVYAAIVVAGAALSLQPRLAFGEPVEVPATSASDNSVGPDLPFWAFDPITGMTIVYSEILVDGPEHFNVLGQDATGYLYDGVTATGQSLGYTFALDFQNGSREKIFLSDDGVRLFSLTAGMNTWSRGAVTDPPVSDPPVTDPPVSSLISQGAATAFAATAFDVATPEPTFTVLLAGIIGAICLGARFSRRARA